MQHIPPFFRQPVTLITIAVCVAACIILLARFGPLSVPDASNPTQSSAAMPTTDVAFGLADDEAAEPSAPEATAAAETVTVQISGAVALPDVYTLPVGARIKDLVAAAGGLSNDADIEQVNLARHLKDEDHISIPRIGAAQPTAAPALPGTDVATGSIKQLDINTASATELEGLDGIGPALAQRIVEYRTTKGPFVSVEDLKNVKGIGSALFDTIAPAITVEPL